MEKDWLSFGHPFSDRLGMPTLTGSGNMPFELPRQSSTGSFSSSPMRQASGSFTSQAPNTTHTQTSNHSSPIFLQVRTSEKYVALFVHHDFHMVVIENCLAQLRMPNALQFLEITVV